MVIILGCSLFTTCNRNRDGDGSTRNVIDMAGRTVAIPKTVNKVFVEWASGITLAMTLGATDKLIAIPSASESDSSAWAKIICPQLGDIEISNNYNTNVEVVLGYNPDVVITGVKSRIEQYVAVGLPTIYCNFINNDTLIDYDTLKETILIFGKVFGENELEVAKKYNKYLDDNIAMVAERTALIATADKPKVYYVDARFNDIYHTVGTGEIQGSWITIAGGTLATTGYFEGRNIEITAEKFLSIDPDILMIGAQNQAEVYDKMISDTVISELSAVRNNKVYRIPQRIYPWCRTGPEAALQVIWAGKLLHPELFQDIDVAIIAKDFYKYFYGTDISDEHLQGILGGKLTPTGK
jgi:iron complex transport system substrate-binding protein